MLQGTSVGTQRGMRVDAVLSIPFSLDPGAVSDARDRLCGKRRFRPPLSSAIPKLYYVTIACADGASWGRGVPGACFSASGTVKNSCGSVSGAGSRT